MNVRQAQACDLQQLPVSMAMRSHLFSYRTQKLSSSAQMVLGWTRPGRVCRRRFPKQKHSTSVGCFCFVHDESDFSNVSLFADETTRRSAKRRYNRLLQVAVRFGVPAESIFGGVTCGVPGRRGCNTPMLGDERFIKLYPLTSAWERKIFLKQEDKECFLYVGDGAKKT